MATLQLGDGEGYFTVNGTSLPKGQFYINKSGPRVSIIATNNLTLQITGRYNEWIGAAAETFTDVDAAGSYIDDLIGVSEGDGSATTDASLLTSGTLSNDRLNGIPQSKVENLITDLASKATTLVVNGKQDTLVSGTNIRSINGTSLLGAGDLTVENYLDVTRYGATKDGITDDTDAITAAIAACPALGGTIYFPRGQYLVTSKITITKPIHFMGEKVMRYTTSGNAQYEAGSVIVTNDATGITAFDVVSQQFLDEGIEIDNRAPTFESLHFRDAGVGKSKMLVIRMMNHGRIRNCSFSKALTGIEINAETEDASWWDIDNCLFAFNTTGIHLTQDVSSTDTVPVVGINGGAFMIGSGQIGIKAYKAMYTRVQNLKMDLSGKGIVWLGGSKLMVANVGMEINTSGDTVGIEIDPTVSAFGAGGITITAPSMNINSGTATCIRIKGGPTANFPTKGISILGGELAGGNLGLHVETGVSGVSVIGTAFKQHAVACAQLDSGSWGTQLLAVQNNTEIGVAGGIVDNAENTVVNGYLFVDGGDRTMHNASVTSAQGSSTIVPKIWTGTTAAYDAIVTKDNNTIYIKT